MLKKISLIVACFLLTANSYAATGFDFGNCKIELPDSTEAAAIVGEEDAYTKALNRFDNVSRTQKTIIQRKFYAGMFDNEIPVQLYVRYLKGNCPEVTCVWEAIYKFGDQDDYIKLTVSKSADGKWTFTEDPPQGVMELKLENGKYTGTWTSTDNQTGYDVKLSEIEATPKKTKQLDEVFERQLFAK